MSSVDAFKLSDSISDLSRPLEACTRMALKYGPGFSITVPGVRIIDISKPEWLEYIQKSRLLIHLSPQKVKSLISLVLSFQNNTANFDNYEKVRKNSSSTGFDFLILMHVFSQGIMFRSLMVDLFGDGILVIDGASWKRARMVTARMFHAGTFKVRSRYMSQFHTPVRA